MLGFKQFISEAARQVKIDKNPTIGWWLDNDPVTFYHGTHESNLEGILKDGLYAPKEGPTADWVSLALDPNTAHGYASMGGESSFRAAGARAKHIPHDERVTLVIKIPQKDFLKKMAPERGAMQGTKGRLKNKEQYEEAKKKGMSDQEYYALTEIRYPKKVPAKYIKAYGYLRK